MKGEFLKFGNSSDSFNQGDTLRAKAFVVNPQDPCYLTNIYFKKFIEYLLCSEICTKNLKCDF